MRLNRMLVMAVSFAALALPSVSAADTRIPGLLCHHHDVNADFEPSFAQRSRDVLAQANGIGYCAWIDAYLSHTSVSTLYVEFRNVFPGSGSLSGVTATACIQKQGSTLTTVCGTTATAGAVQYVALQPSVSVWNNVTYQWDYAFVDFDLKSNGAILGLAAN